MTWPQIWEGRSAGCRVIRLALLPASWPYQIGWRVYRGLYSLGIKKALHPHAPVVCVGNLVTGGSGKTPVTIHIARVLRENVCISVSGYGSPRSEAATLAPDGELDAREWGDEAALIRRELPDIPLIVGRRRVLAAQLCHEHFPGSLMLMDDGMQHLPLHKDLTILIEYEGQNRFCLPAGPFREPPSFARFASIVLGERFRIVHSELSHGLTPGTEVSVLTAIGNPDAFIGGLSEAGLTVKQTRILPDHHPLDAPEVLAGLPYPIIVTAKDAVKLGGQLGVVVATRTTTIEPAEEFSEWLMRELGR